MSGNQASRRGKNGCALGSMISFIFACYAAFQILSFFQTGVAGFISGFTEGLSPEGPSPVEYREGPEVWEGIRESGDPRGNQIQFPDDFLEAPLAWQRGRRTYKALWHLYPPSLKESRQLLEELDYRAMAARAQSKGVRATDTYPHALYWTAVYNQVIRDNQKRLDNIVEGYLWFQQKEELSRTALLDLVVQSIQQIPYEIPEDDPFGLYTPQEVLLKNRGDCDSKSLLLVLILRRLGYDAIVVASDYYRHAMAAVAYNATGDFLTHRGRNYYFIESTNHRRRIGELPPDFGIIKKWYPVPIL